jgi:hypothetical protein
MFCPPEPQIRKPGGRSMLKYSLHTFARTIILNAALLLAHTAFAQNGPAMPRYAGFLDHAGCDSLEGWAADKNLLSTAIQVRISSDGQAIASIPANLLRSDVGSALGDNGMHGFSLPTPASLLDGHAHTIRVTFESSTAELVNSPASLTCAAQLPPLCADVVVTTTPPYGTPYTRVNRYCRDRYGRTRYDYGRFSTINNLESEIVLDTASQTYMVTSLNSYVPGSNEAYDHAVAADLASPAPPPPPRDPAGCPTGNEGWSSKAQPPPNTGEIAPVPQQVVNVWVCPSFALPMYTQIVDPVLGTMEIDYELEQSEPADELFVIPPGYVQDNLLSLSSWGPNCAPQPTLDPVILVSNNLHPARTAVTFITSGYAGCSFVDSTITVGRSLSARALTARALPIYQLLVADNQDSQYANSVDFARLTLTTSDGSVSNSLIIRLVIH